MFSDGMHADETCPNSVRLQAGARGLSNVCRGRFTRGYRGRVRDFTEHFAARNRRTNLYYVIFLCDGCLLLLNTTSMQGRQNSGCYSDVAEGPSLRFVVLCGWARDSRRFEGTTIFWNVPHSVTSQETWLCHHKIRKCICWCSKFWCTFLHPVTLASQTLLGCGAWSTSGPSRLDPEPRTEGWVGLRDGLDVFEKGKISFLSVVKPRIA
jgi:hypothetical protein